MKFKQNEYCLNELYYNLYIVLMANVPPKWSVLVEMCLLVMFQMRLKQLTPNK